MRTSDLFILLVAESLIVMLNHNLLKIGDNSGIRSSKSKTTKTGLIVLRRTFSLQLDAYASGYVSRLFLCKHFQMLNGNSFKYVFLSTLHSRNYITLQSDLKQIGR